MAMVVVIDVVLVSIVVIVLAHVAMMAAQELV